MSRLLNLPSSADNPAICLGLHAYTGADVPNNSLLNAKKIIKWLLNEREYTQLQYRLIPLLLVISMLIKPINLNNEKKLSTIITDIYPITKKSN